MRRILLSSIGLNGWAVKEKLSLLKQLLVKVQGDIILEVLVSTMYQRDESLLMRMNIQSDVVVVNQCDSNESYDLIFGDYKVRWINSINRGLSKSRNAAISVAQDDICLLADDDLVYVDQYSEIIEESFRSYPEADIIAFQVYGIEAQFKKYPPNSCKIGYVRSMRLASVEIAFRLNKIKESGVQFDEKFGAGAKYFMGEENIFLYDCLRRGLKIVYVPVKIADLHIGDSTWFKGYNDEYFVNKGAAFTRMTRMFSPILILQFGIRKYRTYKKTSGLISAVLSMLAGRRKYLNLSK